MASRLTTNQEIAGSTPAVVIDFLSFYFALHSTERVELATEEFIPFSNVLEDLFILQKNSSYERDDKMNI